MSADLTRALEQLGLPRCPAGLPIVSIETLRDPDALQALAASGAVHRGNIGGREPGWIVTGYDAVAAAMVEPRLDGAPPYLHERPEGELPDEEDLLFLPPDEHRRLRHTIARHLTPRRVEALRPRIQGEIDRLLDGLPTDEPFDFRDRFARPLPAAVLCELLDVPLDRRPHIEGYIHGWVAEAGDGNTPVTQSAGVALAGYLAELIDARIADPGDDLVSAMATAGDPRPDPADVLSALRLLLVTGHRPVTRLLDDSLALLLREPARWQELRAAPERVPRAVEELLRFVTPAAISSRYAATATELDGVPIPPGDGVHCALVQVNRDPGRFIEPDTLDLGRAEAAHMAFGLGHRHCLGAALARAEARLALAAMLRRYPAPTLVEAHDGGPSSPRTGDRSGG